MRLLASPSSRPPLTTPPRSRDRRLASLAAGSHLRRLAERSLHLCGAAAARACASAAAGNRRRGDCRWRDGGSGREQRCGGRLHRWRRAVGPGGGGRNACPPRGASGRVPPRVFMLGARRLPALRASFRHGRLRAPQCPASVRRLRS